MKREKFVLWFDELSAEDIPLVGGKCANLGEIIVKTKIPVPEGFAITAYAYKYFIEKNKADSKINSLLRSLDPLSIKKLESVSKKLRKYIEGLPIPEEISKSIIYNFKKLSEITRKDNLTVAVRSSATAEDLPGSSFAGQQDTYLNINQNNLLKYVKKCWSSLFTPRAIVYRKEKGFSHSDVLISVAIQVLVDSKKSGVMFTIEPVSGNRDVIVINASWGLGEAIVSGKVIPDEYVVSKKDLTIIQKKISRKEKQIIPVKKGTILVDVEEDLRNIPALTDEQIIQLAEYGIRLERHYGHPQDIEWTVDKEDRIFILQARPETLFIGELKSETIMEERGIPMEKDIILRGIGVSPGQGVGKVRIIMTAKEISNFEKGDILVTDMTTPDWVPIMKIASAIVTNAGGKTCHAAIVSRELGVPCVVGTTNATSILKEGEIITVDGQKGLVYKGNILEDIQTKVQKSSIVSEPQIITATKVYVNLSIPEIAKKVAEETKADGVGLLRAEHLMLSIGKHPRLLIEEGGEEVMIETFAKGVSQVAEAFFPGPVVYRFLDFKPDEFLELPGGEKYEREHIGPNPMIGYRGEYRYAKEDDIFRLELRAIKKARENMGYTNIWVMIPFVRTLDIFKKTIEIMKEEGLDHKINKSFQLWVMIEVPSAVFMIKELCEEGIDGVSFGTNDLTMLILGVDRNDKSVQEIYDERNLSVLRAIAYTMKVCRKYGVTTSICGQAPSVYPDYLEFMIRCGCTSVSVNPDAVLSARKNIAMIEKKILMEKALGIEAKPKIAKIPIEKVFFWKDLD